MINHPSLDFIIHSEKNQEMKEGINMKNRKIIVIFVLLFIALFAALIFINYETSSQVSYFIDDQTGVEYITYHKSITPRLDASGKVMVKNK